jgi:hypothetical protein
MGKTATSDKKLFTYPKKINSLMPIPAGTPMKNIPIHVAKK